MKCPVWVAPSKSDLSVSPAPTQTGSREVDRDSHNQLRLSRSGLCYIASNVSNRVIVPPEVRIGQPLANSAASSRDSALMIE